MGELPEITGKMVKVRICFHVSGIVHCFCGDGLLPSLLVLLNAEHHSGGFS